MKKTLIISLLTMSMLLVGIFIAYAAQGEMPFQIPFLGRMDPISEEFNENKGEIVELIGIPVTIKTEDGKVYETTSEKFIKERAKIEKELGVEF